ncbi:CRISPR-associated Csx11 family protein [Thermosipho japonicus]|uniref:CRISPR-associated Csx11 family protein n=1 Tax=Thermosipho japonicus TaxID=90323 RepID=A0A841GGQ7_9BACT|nr:CRISPR-associated protein Csx11 [Thermosipho japonicus]MBB6062782.1 CRISPR-associated Csx11 family protein [Thermosipho japonicus]
MDSCAIEKILNHKEDILKAEIGALLFNIGKTHIGLNNWIKYFPNAKQKIRRYEDYYDKLFKDEIDEVDQVFKNFFNQKIRLPNSSEVEWIKVFDKDFEGIFFRGCENLNSGIDKGFPKEILKRLYISNAFGGFVESVEEKNFDEKRKQFFKNLHNYLKDNNGIENSDWRKVRSWILLEIKKWYTHLLSDNRFPVNDVTLYDQVYMVASLYKAALSGLYLYKEKVDEYINKPSNIKWCILGIQYDKLGLSEKALKISNIQWYRKNIKKVDSEVKQLLEEECPIGNEIYRDETGIYFVVSELLKGEKEGEFYKLKEDLKKLEEKIIEKFREVFNDEIYPAIFLSESSRGLMNLGKLIEKAPENFLKAKVLYKNNENNNNNSLKIGVCQICGVRTVEKKSKLNELICDTCLKRQGERMKNWLDNRNGETIWLDELQDKNGRIALITLKFEPNEWINGNFFNSLLVRVERQSEYENVIKSLLIFIENQINSSEVRKLQLDQFDEKNIEKFLSLFDEGGIKKPYENIFENLKKNKSFDNVEEKNRKIAVTLIKEKAWLEHFSFYDSSTNEIIANTKKKKKYPIEEYYNKKNVKDHLYKIFAINYLILQIKNLILERAIGSRWESLILKNLSDDVINFEQREINWRKLDESTDIEFLSKIILQFLLRKNPSPARLRRIWETTKSFFENLEKKKSKLLGFPKSRCQRLYWERVNIPDGEYADGDILFWAKRNTVYLISSIEKVGNKDSFEIKKIDDDTHFVEKLYIKDANKEEYEPFFTILSPTPVSWQLIIPAEYVPNLIESVKNEYYKYFKWVYGKLPLHIGIVVQNYKKPLYVGLKALRRIRRDFQKWEDLKKKITVGDFKSRQKHAGCCCSCDENNSEQYYSLFERADAVQRGYAFYLYPSNDAKVWIDTTQNSNDKDIFWFYPNTFDFEFLDSNARRNEIYYEKGKRKIFIKKNRPYDVEDWQYFSKFNEFFKNDINSESKLQKLVTLIYSKLLDWDDLYSLKIFILSSFVNVLELMGTKKDEFAKVFGVENWESLEKMPEDKFEEKLYMFIDMFEFWYKILKV